MSNEFVARAVRNHRGVVLFLIVLTLGVGIVIGTIITGGVSAGPEFREINQLKIQGDGKPLGLAGPVNIARGFSEVAKVIEPAVVNINTEAVIKTRNRAVPRQGQQPPEGFDLFGDDLWDRFFGDRGGQGATQRVKSLGSGVIVDSAGYILTNFHVVDGADKIRVTLQNGKEFIATVKGTDETADLAVLKVESPIGLPFAQVGDSQKVEVGDWILAVGSPFGFEQTVTAGIVSATGRKVETGIFGSYIQTDAAINPGNSGGPLVNLAGEVIGINAFISTTQGARGNVGVGFAIPSTVFINSYNQIVQKGKVEYGFLGISMNLRPLTPEMARYFGVAGSDPSGVKDGDGILVADLLDEKGNSAKTGPAARAGIEIGDVIVRINDKEVEDRLDLRTIIGTLGPGEEIRVTLVRRGEVKTVKVRLAERTLSTDTDRPGQPYSLDQDKEPEPPRTVGLEFEDVSAQDAKRLGLDGGEGVLIRGVVPGSIADEAQLAAGMVITQVNGRNVASGRQFKDIIAGMKSGEAVILRIVTLDPSTGKPAWLYTSFLKP
ncbi:MAG: trypsin-like peptidase domain-containing protein [Acidobacteriota bacterium]